MHWHLSYRADPLVKPLADRHYNRQNPDSYQFAPPGKCVVLRTANNDAFWITLAPFAQYVRHQWAGAWTCTAFRNEGSVLSSVLIKQAVAATLFLLGSAPPDLGFITFVNPAKINSSNPGCCFKKAGWKFAGFTQSRLYALQLLPAAFPSPSPPIDLVLSPSNPLSMQEKDRLKGCEQVIERGLRTFVEAGFALRQIHNEKLYREEYRTFQHYCEERWQLSRFYAHRLIAASGVVQNLLPIGNTPTHESQLRPLIKLKPEQQRKVWKLACADSASPTAAQVERAVQTILGDDGDEGSKSTCVAERAHRVSVIEARTPLKENTREEVESRQLREQLKRAAWDLTEAALQCFFQTEPIEAQRVLVSRICALFASAKESLKSEIKTALGVPTTPERGTN
jgi:hypothetical protein